MLQQVGVNINRPKYKVRNSKKCNLAKKKKEIQRNVAMNWFELWKPCPTPSYNKTTLSFLTSMFDNRGLYEVFVFNFQHSRISY